MGPLRYTMGFVLFVLSCKDEPSRKTSGVFLLHKTKINGTKFYHKTLSLDLRCGDCEKELRWKKEGEMKT